MCGIDGFFAPGHHLSQDHLEGLVKAASDALVHRGPDGEGFWVDAGSGIALGHRRLAIIDLSRAGDQPMVSSCGRFVLCYNGEVYNSEALRQELEQAGRRFRGHSDTEVIVEATAEWGLRRTVDRLIGMFAFAVWDRRESRLTLVRDRVGIKPLYWYQKKGCLAFSSELTALRRLMPGPVAVDRHALASYLAFGYVPEPLSILDGVNKLEAGCILEVQGDGKVRVERYWDLVEVAQRAQDAAFTGSEGAALEELESLLLDAVRRRMVADVPLGAFLSGGIDSSLVVSLMQAAGSNPVKTFTIGFDVPGYNEAEHAKKVAAHLGTDHSELYVSSADALAVIPRLPQICDEPFGDESLIPTFLLSELARREVTVALSGDGGDELFGGYNRYRWGRNIERAQRLLPSSLRRVLANTGSQVAEKTWNRLLSVFAGRTLPAMVGGKVHKALPLLSLDNPVDMYRSVVSQWQVEELGMQMPVIPAWERAASRSSRNVVEYMQLMDSMTYLPGDILTKVDRASMAVSLEARVPILDHRVVEFSWSLPACLKLRGQSTKFALRKILERHVPRAMVERPKAGFDLPVAEWLRGPLREWGEDLIGRTDLESDLGLNAELIRQRWQEHQSEQRNWQHPLWTVLVLLEWCSWSKAAGSLGVYEKTFATAELL